MMIANATGCSSIWGGTAPSIPYCTDNATDTVRPGRNSLFEDNAEYGYGMHVGVEQIRRRWPDMIEGCSANQLGSDLKAACEEWLAHKDEGEGRERAGRRGSIAALEPAKGGDALLAKSMTSDDFLVKRSQWIFGGDGWAYDIGYGGLDHVMASGEDVNVLVFDTEVYSNTGGQSSKSTPTGGYRPVRRQRQDTSARRTSG